MIYYLSPFDMCPPILLRYLYTDSMQIVDECKILVTVTMASNSILKSHKELAKKEGER